MLSTIFQTILEKVHRQINIDKKVLIELLELIQSKNLNSYLYPELLTELFNLDMNTCLKILIILEKEDILQQVYKVYCPVCQDFSSDIFKSINEVEQYEFCEECGRKLIELQNPYKYVVVYFKVIHNE